MFTQGVEAKADSWGEPQKTVTVKQTKSKRTVKLKARSASTKTVTDPKQTQNTSTTKISTGKKVVTEIQTVTQNTTKYQKGSTNKKITTVKTVTTTVYTYTYYYDLRVGIKSNGQQNIMLDLNVLKRYYPQKLIDLLNAQGVHVYLYSSHPIFQKQSVVGLAVWKENEKNAYVREDQWYVVIHEVGHLLDSYAQEKAGLSSTYCSTSAYFRTVFEKDRNKVDASYKTSIKEYFAESFMYYYLRPSKLRAERPDTYQAIQMFVGSF
jgi:hypothetical protein